MGSGKKYPGPLPPPPPGHSPQPPPPPPAMTQKAKSKASAQAATRPPIPTHIEPHGYPAPVGQFSSYQYPQLTIQTNTNGEPGHININGGFSTYRWGTVHGQIPYAVEHIELLGNILNSYSGQNDQHTRPLTYNNNNYPNVANRVTELPDNHHHYNHAPPQQQRFVEAPPVIAVVPPALTAANLRKATSDAMTSVSRRPTNPHARTPHSIASTASVAPKRHAPASEKQSSEVLRCCHCNVARRPNEGNVKAVNGIPFCYRCILQLDTRSVVGKWR